MPPIMGVEQRPDQQHQGQQPGNASNDQQAQERREQYVASVMEHIQRLSSPDRETIFDFRLREIGLLSGLEEAGVVPVPDFEVDEERWEGQLEKRRHVLTIMEIGAALQRYFPHVAHHLVTEEQTAQQGEQQASFEQRQAALLRYVESVPGVDIVQNAMFESVLDRRGVLSRLEEVGVLPVVINPNPYVEEYEQQETLDAILDDERITRWGDEHPADAEQFGMGLERREETTKYLYLGALLRRNFPELAPT
jgi:hypothetical protein